MATFLELNDLREQIIRIKETEKIPLVIVGNKSDLSEDRAVTHARAIALSQKWGRVPFYETSARRRLNVDEVFLDLCRQIMRQEMLTGQSVKKEGRRGGDGRLHEDGRGYPEKGGGKKRHFCVVL